MAQDKMVQTTIQLPVELRDWLNKTARVRYDSMAGLIRQGVLLLQQKLAEEKETGAPVIYPVKEEKLVIGGN